MTLTKLSDQKYLVVGAGFSGAVIARELAIIHFELTAELSADLGFDRGKGDRSTGGTKPATLETGAEIQVPLFIESDTKVKVDTRDGSYLGRVND